MAAHDSNNGGGNGDGGWARRRRESVRVDNGLGGDPLGIWQQFQDTRGQTFYHNRLTGASQWDVPPGWVADMTAAPPPDAAIPTLATPSPIDYQQEAGEDEAPMADAATVSPYTVTSESGGDAAPAFSSSSSAKKRKRGKPRRLSTKLSFGRFHQASTQNLCYSIGALITLFLVIVFAIVVVVLSFNSDDERDVLFGVKMDNTNTWSLYLISLCFGILFLALLAGCMCFRFRVFEGWRCCSACTASVVDHESAASRAYESHLITAKAHLREQNMDLMTPAERKAFRTQEKKQQQKKRRFSLQHSLFGSSKRVSHYEGASQKAVHNVVAHRRERERNHHLHHKHRYHRPTVMDHLQEEDASADDDRKIKRKVHGHHHHRTSSGSSKLHSKSFHAPGSKPAR